MSLSVASEPSAYCLHLEDLGWWPRGQVEATLQEALGRVEELSRTVDDERAARSAACDELEARQIERDEALKRAAALESENQCVIVSPAAAVHLRPGRHQKTMAFAPILPRPWLPRSGG